MVYSCRMRKNLEKIVAKLRVGISRDHEHLERLRHCWNNSNEMLEAAQIEADESRRIFERLRVTPASTTMFDHLDSGKA